MNLQSVPRNHIRYISWIAYLVRRDPKSGQLRDSIAVKNSPHSNYYLQDGIDMGTIMDTDVQVKEVSVVVDVLARWRAGPLACQKRRKLPTIEPAGGAARKWVRGGGFKQPEGCRGRGT